MNSPDGVIRVLVVDDSRVVRTVLEQIVGREPDMVMVGAASDPFEAVECMRSCAPDVIILDLEMPRMDGLTFLGKIMKQHPIPVIVCSAYVGGGSGEAVAALERGAVEIIAKPKVGARGYLDGASEMIADTIRAAAMADVHRGPRGLPVMTPPVAPPVRAGSTDYRRTVAPADRIVVMGASTGGTEALGAVLQALPEAAPGIVIAQHMPAGFTAAFARRLDEQSALSIKEAEAGDEVVPGTAFVAPGDRHVAVDRRPNGTFIQILETPQVNRHRPSVDVLFRSAAQVSANRTMGVLMTGMGNDGASGLLELRHAGGRTIAQDEATSVVYGMPAAAEKLGAAEAVVPLGRIADEVMDWGLS